MVMSFPFFTLGFESRTRGSREHRTEKERHLPFWLEAAPALPCLRISKKASSRVGCSWGSPW